MEHETDTLIILECLYEVYANGEVVPGKTIQSTMVYPFVHMLEPKYIGVTPEQIHKLLWRIFIKVEKQQEFCIEAEHSLNKYEKEKVK